MATLIRKLFCIPAVLWLFSLSAMAQTQPTELTEAAKECLNCHSRHDYTFHKTDSGKTVENRLDSFLIDSLEYSRSVHGKFSCDDCHSPDYATYPHSSSLKEEYLNTCQDCHVGDKAFAHLQFDEIDLQAKNSIHAQKMGDAFKCEICHNPHTTRMLTVSGKNPIHDIVSYSNGLCLSCHANENRYRHYSDSLKPEIHEIHEWLPNQALHFKHVRCIECHTPKTDTLRVAHLIVPKEEAIKGCVECHSKDGLLETKLTRYLSARQGVNDSISTESIKKSLYLVGTSSNRFLTVASALIFGLSLAAIAIHIIARTIKRKRHG